MTANLRNLLAAACLAGLGLDDFLDIDRHRLVDLAASAGLTEGELEAALKQLYFLISSHREAAAAISRARAT
jgi:hypothetical protein